MAKIKMAWSVLTWLPKVTVYLWRAVRWARRMDDAGVAFMSDDFVARARKRAEEIVLGWAEGQDKGVRVLFWSDNALLRACGIFLKSDAILAVCVAKPSAQSEAKSKLRNKDPEVSIRQWDNHGNHPGV